MKEADLVSKVKKGKSSAQFKVYQTYSPLLRGLCCRYIHSSDEAEDVLQEGFLRIFTKIGTFKYTGENSFFYWMKRVMINHAINYLKKNKNSMQDESLSESHYAITEDEPDVFSSENTKFTREDVIQALNQLSLPFKTVLNLSVIDGLKHKEIAEILNVAEETSRSRLTRAKQMLKRELSLIEIKKSNKTMV